MNRHASSETLFSYLKHSKRTLVASAILLLIALLSGTAVISQTEQRKPVTSELAQQNMSLVAASPAEIKAVLVGDSGLMVELKRWVAKDATDHGQIISESDLTNDAIFDRLEADVRFRSIATLLLQRYGYLIPRVNPDSPAGKEQELLVQERVKWITQEEEENRQEERVQRQQDLKDLQKARACAEGVGAECPRQQQPSLPVQTAGQTIGGGGTETGAPFIAPTEGPLLPNPPEPNLFNFPATGSGTLQQTQLLENGPDGMGLQSGNADGAQLRTPRGQTGGLSDSIGVASSDSSSLFPGLGGGSNEALNSGAPLRSLPLGGALGANSGAWNSTGGLLTPGDFGSDGYSLDNTPRGGLETMSPAYPPGTPVVPRASYGRVRQSHAALEPTMARVPNPYHDIPSLYDMYVQALPHPAASKRFGIDVFENGTRDPQLIPMDLPAGPDYVIGPGDGLAIDLWGSVSRRIVRTVDREGRVSLPEVGPVLVSGKSLADAQQALQQSLRTQFRDISAAVSLSRLRTVRVYEVGDISNPGAYDVSSLSTPLNALFVAGGPTSRGSLRIVKHYRGNQLIQEVDLYDLLLRGVRGDIQRLGDGDTILVPPVGTQVTVEGMVRRPAIYELKEEKDLASVLELAGGVLPTATLRHIEVERLVAHEKRTMLSLDIPEGDGDASTTGKLKSFQIQDGDRIRVFPISQGNENAVYLEGHVIRPGRYAYHEGMRITDLIPSFKELLPQPATEYAEIIRLNAPDLHPTVESFDLADALANPSQAPALHAMDTVRIFSRFAFENPPTVAVLGDVRLPGTYQTSGQIRLSDAVHLAGGLAPDAQKEDAQVFRYLPDGKSKIFSVNLSDALAGNEAENIVLEPRDRVLVHRSPDAEQPAIVYIQGEVEKPGRYPLTTNMTVADLIRVGGGLKPSADSAVGDLTQYGWANGTKLSGGHDSINIAAALKGDPTSNAPLHNGDVVTIRQLPNWSDLGASITVKGEVKHPGTYGIRPSERLSSILERAGGLESSAYPYGAVLQRVQVRELETKQQDRLILRMKDMEHDLQGLPEGDARQKQAKQAALAQYQTTLTELTETSPAGRVAIRISSNMKQWKNTAADIEVRAGDTLTIPKRPEYVMVTGQVFNPTAVAFRPGKSAKWYLSQSGGPTTLANKKKIFVIRADGSVIGDNTSTWGGSSLNATLLPGDTVVVPEKAVSGGPNWQTLFTSVQVASSVATTVLVAMHY